MIKLENIYKNYQTKDKSIPALMNINLSVAPGEIFGVMGRSGAGKSTLIRCVNLLERPDSGSVWVNNWELLQLSPKQLRQARHHIGMIFQHFNLLNTRTVYENVALPLELLGQSKKTISTTVMPLLELVGLSAKAPVFPHQLSGGQKQRVGIARALATKPKVLLCDEMTSALDPETTASILALIKNINRQFNLSVLLITHEMDVIKSIADRVAIMDSGKIVEQSDVLSLFKDPQTEIAKKFVYSGIKKRIPEKLANKIKSVLMQDADTLLSINFMGKTAAEPIIHGLIKKFDLPVNIIEAHLELLRQETIGVMLISVQAEPHKIQQGIQYLTQQGLTVEIIGYVDRNDWLVN